MGILGEHTPQQLLETIVYLVGLHCALWGGEEHKMLRRLGCNSQFELIFDSNGARCLRYREDAYSKTNQGGISKRYHEPKVVNIYENTNRERCLVRLFDKYVSLLLTT